jgi:hypothetical protein
MKYFLDFPAWPGSWRRDILICVLSDEAFIVMLVHASQKNINKTSEVVEYKFYSTICCDFW